MIKFLFILALGLSFFVTPSSCDPYYVHITNELSHNKVLHVHCKSKDDDLGIHQLPRSQHYSWRFNLNFFATTLFWCYMAPDSNSHANFKVFWKSGYMDDRCAGHHCYWVAKDDGAYLRNPPRPDELQHKWEKGR
ncbi:conserved hypothetical protein [Ricinus communis]|uniref:S-protein homolog n=1 Tax=Ricinus communis TaxID=3988 RepID=B9S575_RICCO|nr:conserved hypothetical protein [Ricinus communis]